MIRRIALGSLVAVASYLLITVYVISRVDSLTLAHLTMDSWRDHYVDHSVPVSPVNNLAAWYVINNRGKERFSDLDDELGVGIDAILGLNWQSGERDGEKVVRLARLFLDNGANVNFVGRYTGCSALHQALARRDKLSVEFLRENDADFSYRSVNSKSPKFCQLSPEEILERVGDNEQFWEGHESPCVSLPKC